MNTNTTQDNQWSKRTSRINCKTIIFCHVFLHFLQYTLGSGEQDVWKLYTQQEEQEHQVSMYAREFPIRALQALIENKHDSQFININLHQSCTTQ